MNEYLSRKIKVLSFLSIILVLYLHSSIGGEFVFWKITESAGPVNNIVVLFLSQGITRIAVPLFMLISGYLFFRNVSCVGQITNKYKSRLRTLVVPFFFWEFLWVLIIMGVVFLGTKAGLVNDSFRQTVYADDLVWGQSLLMAILRPVPVWQLWFLRDLICLVIISPIIYYLTKSLKLVPVLSLIAILSYIFINGDICYKFFEGCYLNRSSSSVVFFMIGAYFAICNQKIVLKKCINKNLPLLLGVIWSLSLLVRAYLSCVNESYYISCMSFQLSVLAGILFVWTGYDIVAERYRLDWLNEYLPYTFFVYCFHIPIMTYLSILLRFGILKVLFGLAPQTGIVYLLDYFITPVLVFFIAIIVAKVSKKYVPGLYNISTGGR